MRISKNWVLVKPDENFKNYNGGKIVTALDADSAGQRLSVRGKIISLPKKLVYNGNEIKKERSVFANDRSSVSIISALKDVSMLYDVNIEPKVGDTVFFNYMEHYECYQNGRWIEGEDGDMLLMRYDNLIVSHPLNNTSAIKPLNGLVLIEPIKTKEEESMTTVELQKYKHKIHKTGLAKVIKTGQKCKGYLEDLNGPEDTNEIKEGQIIIYKPSGAHLLEWGLHQTLFKNRRIMAIHRRNILYYE